LKYIFVAGAPGSKWSSVVKNIYHSPSIDRSDYRDEWTYYHDAGGAMDLMHMGAYFDPGMACALPEYFNSMSKFDAERIFNQPFDSAADGVRIIKSHVFSYKENIAFLRNTWPDCPIVLVHRPDDACLGWWVKCGHFDITYPSYHIYYKDLKTMAKIIKQQNQGIQDTIWDYKATRKHPNTNLELCNILGIQWPSGGYTQNYSKNDIEVTVI
jgi:hypothetical protein